MKEILLLVTILISSLGSPNEEFVYPENPYEGKVLSSVQSWKVDSDKYSYELDPKLCDRAVERSIEIQSDWSHNGFEKYSYDDTFVMNGENLAKSYEDPSLVLDAWLNSPTHKKILEEDFTNACIKCSIAEGNYYCAAEFGK